MYDYSKNLDQQPEILDIIDHLDIDKLNELIEHINKITVKESEPLDNPDEVLEYKYFKGNTNEYFRLKMKAYTNKIIKCDCGLFIKKGNFKKHQKSVKHKFNLQNSLLSKLKCNISD